MAIDIREACARKAAARQGLVLLKAYARNEQDPNFGLYLLARADTNSPVFPPSGEFSSLTSIESYLSRESMRTEDTLAEGPP